MSTAEDDSEDLDLQRGKSSDEHQDALIDSYQPRQSSQELQYLNSDDALSEVSSTHSETAHASHEMAQIAGPSNTGNPRLVPSLEHNPFAKEPSFYTRPNRYFGPDSTWLSWTREERLIAEALDTRRNQDLSIHLFNAYALKRKGQAAEARHKKQPKGKERARSIADDEPTEEVGSSSFLPPRSWTAWPLPPAQVPREDDATGMDEHDTYRMSVDPRPSAVLENTLIATTTRIARHMWRSREWEPELTDRPDVKNTVNQGVRISSQEDVDTVNGEAAETLQTDSESDAEMFQSKRWGLDSKTDSPIKAVDNDETSRHLNRRPTPIADDEEARDILLPSTRHILSKLDSLLMGLHHARQAYATTTYAPSRKRKRNNHQSDSVPGDESAHESGKRQRKRSVSTNVATTENEATGDDSQGRHARRTRLQLNTRDWSDVIGMAALMSWDPAVISRASERCANLFRENMLFRTFFEADVSNKECPSFEEHYAVIQDEASHADDVPSSQEIETVPVRTSAACESCKAFKHKCEPFISSDSDLDINSKHTGPCQRCVTTKQESGCSGISFTLQRKSELTPSTPKSRRCPYTSCSRHRSAFKSSWLLQRHIDNTHKHSDDHYESNLRSSPSQAQSSGAEQYLSSSQTIVCPVTTCPRHEKGFTRGSLMYQHIKNRHPEVDVDEVKKLESRRRGGDGRGRWRDERRHRPWSMSKSRSRSRAVDVETEEVEDEDEDEDQSGDEEAEKDDAEHEGVQVEDESRSKGKGKERAKSDDNEGSSSGSEADDDDDEDGNV